MTNQEQFQQELKEKVKEGIKPSDLKKLKRSKSSETLTTPKEIPLTKSKSVETISLQPSLSEQVKQLKQDLTFAQTNANNYLQRLQELEPLLDSKETEIKELKETNNNLVDQNNELRLQALKNADKFKELEQEITQAAHKLSASDQLRINLQVQNSQLLREKTSLEQRIQQLYQLKGLPHNRKENFPWKSILFTALLFSTITYLLKP